MRFSHSWVTLTILSLMVQGVLVGVNAPSCRAQEEPITPDSEFVKGMVRPAVAYLKNNYRKKSEYGSVSLVGLAIFNAGLRLGKRKEELKSDSVLQEILETVAEEVDVITPDSERTIYAACVTGLLLAEVDEVKYRDQILKVLDFVYARQLPHGGWGYRKETTGDISQTQYASLFMWLAKNKKIPVKKSAVEGAIKYLIAVQKPSGGFVYKAQPGQIYGTETQSLTAAGLGSIYLLGDAYGLHGGDNTKPEKKNSDNQLIPATVTRVVEEDKQKKAKESGPVRQVAGFQACKVRGDAWFGANFVINPANWTYYYLYGFERYSTFKERADGVNPESPFWYVQGAKFLKSQQNGDGSWLSLNSVEQSRDHSTSFAILFLVRSTKLIVPQWTDVFEAGGAGLPESGDLTMRGGRLVNKTYNQDFDKVTALIETGKETDWEAFEATFDQLVLSTKDSSRAEQLATLRKLVTNENPVARKVAVKSIGKFRDFENIPFLIYALTDPEPVVAKMANDGLRFVSRKFDGPRFSQNPSKEEAKAVVKYWTKWYRDVVPDGRLLDE